MPQRTCSRPGCDRKLKGHGLCNMHYQRLRSGTPLDKPPRPSWKGKVCIVDDCNQQPRANGLCSPHLNRMYRNRSLNMPVQMRNPGQACAIDECSNPARKRGWCVLHYERWRAHGDPTITKARVKGTCEVPGCDRPHYARGMCLAHDRRAAKGTPLEAPFRPSKGGVCTAEDCDGHGRFRGLCRKHKDRKQYSENPEHFMSKSARRRQLLDLLDENDRDISTAYRRAIKGDPCTYCGATDASHVDHFFSLVQGGTDHWFNLRKACQHCNLSKGPHCGIWFKLKLGNVSKSATAPVVSQTNTVNRRI